jgi:BolA protein
MVYCRTGRQFHLVRRNGNRILNPSKFEPLWALQGRAAGKGKIAMASVQQAIEQKIMAELAPAHLDVVNESHMHSVPPGSESHFNVVVVSDAFEGQSRVNRHRTVNRILEAELASQIHALALHTHTAAEWAARGGHVLDSPECLGGSKAKS